MEESRVGLSRRAFFLCGRALGRARSALPVLSFGESDEETGPSPLAPRLSHPQLPFEIYTAFASYSVRLFPAGGMSELTFLQREDVSPHHEVEYFTRLALRDGGSERYQPFGVIRLYRGGTSLSPPSEVRRFWENRKRAPEFRTVPAPRRLSPLHGATLGKPGRPPILLGRAGTSRLATLFEAVDMPTPLRIAWLEAASALPPPPGKIVHRYYLTADRGLCLVRHHWARGKTLFLADLETEARSIRHRHSLRHELGRESQR